MSSPASPLTPAQIAAIQQQFNVAYVKAFPAQFWQDDSSPVKNPAAIFELENVGGVLTLVNNLTSAERFERADRLGAQGYWDIMLYEICWLGHDPYEVFSQWSSDGITWYPPWYVETEGGLAQQPNLGQPGQYALPNAYHPDMGLLGPYPTTLPPGWVKIPPMAELLAPGADVAAILKGWF